MRRVSLLLFASVLSVVNASVVRSLRADSLSLQGSDIAIDACEDYFTAKWGEPLNMDAKNRHGDLLNNYPTEKKGFNLSYSGGVAHVTATEDTPYARLLNPGNYGQVHDTNVTRYGDVNKINPSQYPIFSVRMKPGTSSSLGYSVRWDTCPVKGTGYISSFTPLIKTADSWNVYSTDLSNTAPSLGTNQWNDQDKCGLALYPIRNATGATADIDWIQLTKAPSQCSSASVNYTAVGSTPFRLFLDSDHSLANGADVQTPVFSGAGSSSYNFSSSYLFPGRYSVLGVQSPDFMTTELDTWDFKQDTDVVKGIGSGLELANGNGIANGRFCAKTSTTSSSFYLKFPSGRTAASSKYRYFSMKVSQSVGKEFSMIFHDANGNPQALRRINVPAASGQIEVLEIREGGNPVSVKQISVPTGSVTVTKDLFAAPGGGEGGAYTGDVGLIRIDPGSSANSDFCIDWASLSTSPVSSEPSVEAATFVGAGDVVVGERPIALLDQPDKRGALDYFTEVKGNPANFDSSHDQLELVNFDKASANQANPYADNAGNIVYSDYLRLEGLDGSFGPAAGDSQVIFTGRDNPQPIDASLYKIACFDVHNSNLPQTEFQSMIRIIFDDQNQHLLSGDDVFGGVEDFELARKNNKDGDICISLPELGVELEDQSTDYSGHWHGNIKYLRLDTSEEAKVTTILKDFRLVTDHLTDGNFSIVVNGARDRAVNVYYTGQKNAVSGGTLAGTLNQNRNSDVLLWNTTLVPEGKYYFYTVVGGSVYPGEHPVVVDRSSGRGSDSEAPVVSLFAPVSNGRYSTLDLAGSAVDNRRLATVEAFIDGALVSRFVPYKFHKETRDAYRSYAYSSYAGFQESVSLSNISDGAHTLRVDAWDTHGNKTSVTRNFEKASTGLTANFVWPTYNEASSDVPLKRPELPTPQPSQPPAPSVPLLSLSVKVAKPHGILATIGNAGSCKVARLRGAMTQSGAFNGKVLGTLKKFKNGKGAITAKNVKKSSGKGFLFLIAECTSGSSARSLSIKVNAAKFGNAKVKLAKVISSYRFK